MNKEYFLRLCTNHSDGFTSVDTDDLNEFFDSNVCIPKGENIHPDAEILHQYIENCTEDFKLVQFDDALDDWFATDVTSEMRFKVEPSEPVYEWQWALVLNTIGEIGRTIYMTKEEFQRDIPLEQSIYLKIDEETKRVRS